MPKYHLFAWTIWDEGGGWNDHVGSYDTIEEAKALFNSETWIDMDCGQIVEVSAECHLTLLMECDRSRLINYRDKVEWKVLTDTD